MALCLRALTPYSLSLIPEPSLSLGDPRSLLSFVVLILGTLDELEELFWDPCCTARLGSPKDLGTFAHCCFRGPKARRDSTGRPGRQGGRLAFEAVRGSGGAGGSMGLGMVWGGWRVQAQVPNLVEAYHEHWTAAGVGPQRLPLFAEIMAFRLPRKLGCGASPRKPKATRLQEPSPLVPC